MYQSLWPNTLHNLWSSCFKNGDAVPKLVCGTNSAECGTINLFAKLVLQNCTINLFAKLVLLNLGVMPKLVYGSEVVS